ncbi:hypothetical protein [Pleurocapsa sp. PCC 7319]|uniref:hypothetical protein n=1 Tax=Pleurocapsa sp. PCC 7319 TaxID=118161 RepID=UPI00047579A6|nr:hypothetical protein [Pleurocapsa sp. PCC 7319]
MNIRFMGSPDLVERIRNIANKKAKLYDNRGSDDKRFFLEVDDRVVEQWLDLIETANTPINIDPKDFR